MTRKEILAAAKEEARLIAGLADTHTSGYITLFNETYKATYEALMATATAA